MGDKLKEAYLLGELNKKIDNDYQKLSDRFHDLELSHNRKKECLQRLFKFLCFVDAELERPIAVPMFVNHDFVKNMISDIENALFSDGRVNFPVVKRKKMKGGRQCAQD